MVPADAPLKTPTSHTCQPGRTSIRKILAEAIQVQRKQQAPETHSLVCCFTAGV
jgi:hypothetical protein